MINGLRELEIEIEFSGIRKRDRQLDLAEKSEKASSIFFSVRTQNSDVIKKMHL